MTIVKTGIKKSFLSGVTSYLVCTYSAIAKTPATINMTIVKTGIKKSFLSGVTSYLVCTYSAIAKTPATINMTQPITP